METVIHLRDPVSSLTHGFTSVFAIYVTMILWRLAGNDRAKRISLCVFGLSAVVLYAASCLYHAIPLPKTTPTVDFFRRLDHSAIYVLIAGTYTPVLTVMLRGRRRVVMLTLVWSLATAGILTKWITPIANERLTVGLYLAMGWMFLLSGWHLFRSIGVQGMTWIGLGGAAYSGAAACELFKWPVIIPGVVAWHETCHVLDMAGTAFHLMFMIRCVLPYRAIPVATTDQIVRSRAA